MREVFLQGLPDGADPVREPGDELPLPEVLHHRIPDCLPKARRHHGVDPHITDHGELPILNGKIEQRRISMRGPVHLKRREHVPRPGAGIPAAAPLHVHSDLTRRVALRRLNGGDKLVPFG